MGLLTETRHTQGMPLRVNTGHFSIALHIFGEFATVCYNVLDRKNIGEICEKVVYCLAFLGGFWYNKSIEWGYALFRRSLCS